MEKEKNLYKRLYREYLSWKLEKTDYKIEDLNERIKKRTEFMHNCFALGYRDNKGLAKLGKLKIKKEKLEHLLL